VLAAISFRAYNCIEFRPREKAALVTTEQFSEKPRRRRWPWLPVATGPAAVAALCVVSLAGCAAPRAPRVRLALQPPPPPRLVGAMLRRFPRQIDRSFFATVQVGGKRFTAIGRLHSFGPRDFRITVATEMGQLLFDARWNWAGLHLLRITHRISPMAAKFVCDNISYALRVPRSAAGLREKRYYAVLHRRDDAGHSFRYVFAGRLGRLVKDRVDLSFFDTLHVQYRRYTHGGLPQKIVLYRPLAAMLVEITFTGHA
jgi:hypothetical protein